MEQYTLVAQSNESTVVGEYTSTYGSAKHYQSEAELERDFVELLQRQAYDYLPITSEEGLVANLRLQLERLNDYLFTEAEWCRFFREVLASATSGIVEKSTMVQEEHVQLLERDNGEMKNIRLLDKEQIHNNALQVVNQYLPEGGVRENRYDVTVLVNGLPMVHIELKRRGVELKEAFNQINRYQRESFWAGSGLFDYVQLFVISNGTYTKYYSNTTRFAHLKEQQQGGKPSKGKRSSNSYEFTSWWADANNRPITELMDFGATFFSKHTLLNILTRYCVFTSERLLLVMRPYQIAATERILSRIETATNYKRYGTVDGGGYVWHTTGSGKTLTSFKTAQLASRLPQVDQVIFVVDRKDLDHQTMTEYNRFEKGAADSNSNTNVLAKQLGDSNCRIVITTIQKLARLVASRGDHSIFKQHVVLIFDECHRSQFGEMHTAITRKFKKYHLFGFTGTPIFATNSTSGGKVDLKTTPQSFGDKLHTYTIVDAITDQNVLPFRIDYIRTVKEKEQIAEQQVASIDRERALMAPQRIEQVTRYILDHFDQKCKRNSCYTHKERRVAGFNSLFAVASIEVAKSYYAEFRKQSAALPSDQQLKVAIIYSFGANEADDEGVGMLVDENLEDTSRLDQSSRDFLEGAIGDYNRMFSMNFDTSGEGFQNYYKDVSERVKKREVDLLIVVNMFLTGFDATTLNTLWVDKNLRMHGLLQAFSRTNRILNSVKTFGQIVCFRNLEEAANESIALFGNREAGGIVLLKTFEEYYNGYNDGKKEVRGYADLVEELKERFPLGEPIVGEEEQKAFVRLFGTLLKAKNILTTFDEFEEKELLSERDGQDYQSHYIQIYEQLRKHKPGEAANIIDDLVFEMELVKQVEINIDYILLLIQTYRDGQLKDKEIVVTIQKAIGSSLELRNKRELIEAFIVQLTPESVVEEEWSRFVEQKRREELDAIIREERLRPVETYGYIEDAFADGYLQTAGMALANILPPMSRFNPTGDRTKLREVVHEKLSGFFQKFQSISESMLRI